jgi:hypothetical protein
MESNSRNPPDGMWPTTFRQAFCKRYHCPPEHYESRAFRRSLFLHALPFAALLQRFDPAFFREDYDLIREVGPMTDPELFRSEINYFYGRNLRHKGWIRSLFRMRVSGNRLIRLKQRLFPCSSS